jgi:hypothetical protein
VQQLKTFIDQLWGVHARLFTQDAWTTPPAQLVSKKAHSSPWAQLPLGQVAFYHPPIEELGDFVQFLQQQPRAGSVLAPMWPAQAWFQVLLDLSVEVYRVPRVVWQPQHQQSSSRPPGDLAVFRLRHHPP